VRPADFNVVDLLVAAGSVRDPRLLPIRYHRMAADPLGFLRGAADVQARDLVRGASTHLDVQLCGDAHAMNFGVFASPERRMVFDVNDFDETARGPFEWDVKRLAVSAVLAARAAGRSADTQERVGQVVADAYRTAITAFAEKSTLDIWYSSLDLSDVVGEIRHFFTDEHSELVSDVLAMTPIQSDRRRYARIVTEVDGDVRFVSDPPLVTPLEEPSSPTDSGALRTALGTIIDEYASTLTSERRTLLRRFTPVDAAHKVVGVGSVGTRCYVVLLLGRDGQDPFVLQVKEAGESAVDAARATVTSLSPGERVVQGQRLMQATPDPFLGWHDLVFPDEVSRSFYVRQYYDQRSSVDVVQLPAKLLRAYVAVCAWTLARAHARSGAPIEISSFIGTSHRFDEAIAEYAVSYADQVESDHAALTAAIAAGRITATP
jgi:uncharacterized protein (DUF2252 family)